MVVKPMLNQLYAHQHLCKSKRNKMLISQAVSLKCIGYHYEIPIIIGLCVAYVSVKCLSAIRDEVSCSIGYSAIKASLRLHFTF